MREENPYFSAVVVTWMAVGNTNAALSFVMAVTLMNGIVSWTDGEKEGGIGQQGETGRRLRENRTK